MICIVILPFLPESPRWLADRGYTEAVAVVLAQANTNGDVNDVSIQLQQKEIFDQIAWEKNEGQTKSWVQMFTDRVSRKRILIAVTPAIFSVVAGYPSGYYLGTELTAAGVTDTRSQLEVVSPVFYLAKNSDTESVECRSERLLFLLQSSRNATVRKMGKKARGNPYPEWMHVLHAVDRYLDRPIWVVHVYPRDIRQCRFCEFHPVFEPNADCRSSCSTARKFIKLGPWSSLTIS